MRAHFHLLPYALFVLTAVGAEQAGGVWPSAVEPVRAVLVLALIVVLYRRGAYPDLAQRETPCRHATWLAVGTGLAVGLLWVPLGELAPPLQQLPLLRDFMPSVAGESGGRGGFDANALGPSWAWLLLGGRLAVSILAIPVAEELVVRSLLPRWVDAGTRDWRTLPIGVFTPLAFAITVVFFAVTHPEWLAAAFTAILWGVLLMRTRRLRDAVLAHAVANAVLDAYVLLANDYRWW